MLWAPGLTWAAALLGRTTAVPTTDLQAADSSVYHDSETGFTFSQYNAEYQTGRTMAFRIAVPDPAAATYDVVLQVVAPIGVGWAGLAWGGSMLNNPLAVSWSSGQTPVISSRYATDHVAPSQYSSATYTMLKKGTHLNGTHWQLTAKCTGCTTFGGKTLAAKGTNRLAFAYSGTRPSSPSSSSSSISVHDSFGYWNHDFTAAGNSQFASLVSTNSA